MSRWECNVKDSRGGVVVYRADKREYVVVDRTNGSVIGRFPSKEKASKFITEKRGEGLVPVLRIVNVDEETVVRRSPSEPEPEEADDPCMAAFKDALRGMASRLWAEAADRDELADYLTHGNWDDRRGRARTRSDEKPEEFAKKYLIRPMLSALRYSEPSLEPRFNLPGNKAPDMAMEVEGRDGKVWVILEAKKHDWRLEREQGQLEGYMERFRDISRPPEVGILTDGIEWHLLAYSGLNMPMWLRIDAKPLLAWALGRRTDFP